MGVPWYLQSMTRASARYTAMALLCFNHGIAKVCECVPMQSMLSLQRNRTWRCDGSNRIPRQWVGHAIANGHASCQARVKFIPATDPGHALRSPCVRSTTLAGSLSDVSIRFLLALWLHVQAMLCYEYELASPNRSLFFVFPQLQCKNTESISIRKHSTRCHNRNALSSLQPFECEACLRGCKQELMYA